MNISKFLVFILLFLSTAFNTYSQQTINWTDSYKLKWQDFMGKPDSTSGYMAITDCTISYSYAYQNDSLSYKISSFFNKQKSWTKSKTDTSLLKHEQGHFDINELFTRKLKKAFKEYAFNQSTVNKDLEAIFSNNWKAKNEFDALYDKETNHSKNKQNQDLWNTKIAIELNKLSIYKQ